MFSKDSCLSRLATEHFAMVQPNAFLMTDTTTLLYTTLYRACSPIIFCRQRIINGMTGTWWARFWLASVPKFVFGRLPRQNSNRGILTVDSVTLHSKSIQRNNPFIYCHKRMIKGITSTRLKGFQLGFFQRGCCIHHFATKISNRVILAAYYKTLYSKSIQRIHPIHLFASTA
jgi:hypothetical protein